jgi:chromosomal replication initiator protein
MPGSVNSDDKEIVSALGALIAQRIGEDRFRLWLVDELSWQVADGKVIIRSPASFRLERLQRAFAKDISAAARELLGDAATVAFECTPRDTATLPSESRAVTAPNPKGRAATLQPQIQSDDQATGGLGDLGELRGEDEASVRMYPRAFASLESFVVGETNRLAHSAVSSVLQKLGKYSPLFVYGPPGSGKSHLLEGLWRRARRSNLSRVIYLSAEQFTTQFVEALRGGTGLPNFRRKYRDVELLLIDDLQFFQGKQSTLIELQHTIDTILRQGRQLVFAADRPPQELRGLGGEIVARITGGLVCAVDAADYATRRSILTHLSEGLSATIPADVLDWLASQLDGDARRLAGALHRLEAAGESLDQRIDLPFAQQVLSDLLRTQRKAVRLPDIEGAVCEFFQLDPAALHSDSKSPTISHPRMLAMWLARKYTRSALTEIGKFFGRKSHTTVISAEAKVGQWMTAGKTIHLSGAPCTVEDALKRLEAQLRLG